MFEIVSVTKRPQSTRICTFAIITTDSNELVAEIHHRKREIIGLRNERDFPHLVELALPPEGFRSDFARD
jgi:hypothetical protein